MIVHRTLLISIVSSLATALLLMALFGVVGATLAVSDYAPTAASSDLAKPQAIAAPQAATAYQQVRGWAFSTPGGSSVNPASPGCVASSSGSGTVYHSLLLPHGSIVTELDLFYRDIDADVDATIKLVRFGLARTDVVTLTTSTGASGMHTATVGLNEMLDYSNYSYTMVWDQPSTAIVGAVQLCGFRVAYTPPSVFGVALPLVTKAN